jgi:hypothetical protein
MFIGCSCFILHVRIGYFQRQFSLLFCRSVISQSDFTCPKNDIASGCKNATECIYSDPNACNQYIKCTAGGVVVRFICPKKLLWDDINKICNWPELSTCPNKR